MSTDEEDAQKLKELDEKLKAHKGPKVILHDAKREEQKKDVMKAGASAGVEFAAAILFTTALGVWLDKQFDTAPLFMFILMFGGMIVAFYNLYRASESLSVKNSVSELPNDAKDVKKTAILEESKTQD